VELINQELQELNIGQENVISAENQLNETLINQPTSQLLTDANMGPDEAATVAAVADYSPLMTDKKVVIS